MLIDARALAVLPRFITDPDFKNDRDRHQRVTGRDFSDPDLLEGTYGTANPALRARISVSRIAKLAWNQILRGTHLMSQMLKAA